MVLAQLREYPDESLRGIKAVHVIVHFEAPTDGKVGLTQVDLQSTVETCLEADHIKVIDDQQWKREHGSPYLYIEVVGTRVPTGIKDSPTYVYSFSADLIQQVALTRNRSFTTDGATWSQGYFIVVPKDQLNDVTMQIARVAQDFAASVHAANASP
jgi:hypothetical protein